MKQESFRFASAAFVFAHAGYNYRLAQRKGCFTPDPARHGATVRHGAIRVKAAAPGAVPYVRAVPYCPPLLRMSF